MAISPFTLFVAAAVLVVEAVAAYYFIKYWRLHKQVASTETSSVAELTDGAHEIEGKVISLGQLLTSPYSDKPCVHYDFTVEEKRRISRSSLGKGQNKEEWDVLIADTKALRFGIDDGSGVAVVDLENAEIELRSNNEFDRSAYQEMKSIPVLGQQRILEKYEMEDHGGKSKLHLRYRELMIEEGTQLHVMGAVKGKDGERPLFKVDGTPLRVTDLSEKELLELYTNKFIYAASAMIGVPLGLAAVWFMIGLF